MEIFWFIELGKKNLDVGLVFGKQRFTMYII